MTPAELQDYLHEHIPLSAAMAACVNDVGAESVTLVAPLGPNINHRDTVFGGSASALAILSAWSLVHVRLHATGRHHRIVIQRNTVRYDAPMAGDFSASARLRDEADWGRFITMLERRGKARIDIVSSLDSDGVNCGAFEGTFVAIDLDRA